MVCLIGRWRGGAKGMMVLWAGGLERLDGILGLRDGCGGDGG